MPTSYTNVSTAADLSADIEAIDLASQADGGNGTHYSITLKAGATLTESADISAINLALNDTLTLNGQGAILNGASAFRGLFAYSGKTTIENLTIEKAVAERAAGAAPASAAACSWRTIRRAAQRRPRSRSTTFSSPAIRRSAAKAGWPRSRGAPAAVAVWSAMEAVGLRAARRRLRRPEAVDDAAAPASAAAAD